MSDLLGNPEDRFSHNEAHLLHCLDLTVFSATCERCGAVGIKHAFYSKSKRFCSLNCSKLAKEDDFDDYNKDPKILVSNKDPKILVSGFSSLLMMIRV